MATSSVRLTDVIVPELFTPYDSEAFLTKNAFVATGVAVSDPRVTRLMDATEGGQYINMPFWRVINMDEPKIGSDDPNTKLELDKITAGAEMAVKGFYTKGFSAMTIAGILAGSNPMTAINNYINDFWTTDAQKKIINASIGICADSITNHNGDLISDISTNTGAGADPTVTAEAIIMARGKLGDYQSIVNTIAMHSVVYTNLQTQQLIEFRRDADNNTLFPTFNGMRVVVDDGMPTVAVGDKTAYYTFLYGPGVFGLNYGYVDRPQEINRDPASGNGTGEEKLYSRRSILVHPRGYKVSDSLVNNTHLGLTYAEFAAGTTWTRVIADRKAIPFVAIKSLG